MNFFSWMFIKNRIVAIKYLMVDKSVSIWKKLLIVFGIAYLVMPLDLIPAVLFPVAWMDDLLLWIFIIFCLKDSLDKYWLGEKPVNLEKNYKNKKIIDDVDFSVEEEPKKGKDKSSNKSETASDKDNKED